MIVKKRENKILDNNFYEVFNDDVIFNKKTLGTHVKVSNKNKNDGIAVLPILKNGNILLIKNFRYAANEFVYQVVKGGNDTIFKNNEDVFKCVREEMEEEINISSNDIQFIKSVYESPSILTTKAFVCLAFNCKLITEQKRFREETECIDSVVEISINDIDKFLENKQTCAITLYLIQLYKIKLLTNKK